MIEQKVVGIDPGMSEKSPGAICIMDVNEPDMTVIVDWSSEEEMAYWLLEYCAMYQVAAVVIEEVNAMSYTTVDPITGIPSRKSQKGTSNFKFGRNVGWWVGLFTGILGDTSKIHEVRPQVWQKEFRVPKKRTRAQKPSFAVARELFPWAKQGYLRYKKHHNRADALLLAEYGRRIFL